MSNRWKRIKKQLAGYGIENYLIDGGSFRPTDWELKERVDEGDLVSIECELPYTISGDYIGSRVETSNCKYFNDTYDIVFTHHFGYGSSAAYVTLEDLLGTFNPENPNHGILDDCKDLLRYPVLDEDQLHRLEMEDQDEVWDSWAKNDIREKLEKRIGIDDCLRDTDIMETLYLDDSFQEYLFNNGHSELCSWYYDIKDIVELTWNTDSLRELIIKASLVDPKVYRDEILEYCREAVSNEESGVSYCPIRREYRIDNGLGVEGALIVGKDSIGFAESGEEPPYCFCELEGTNLYDTFQAIREHNAIIRD